MDTKYYPAMHNFHGSFDDPSDWYTISDTIHDKIGSWLVDSGYPYNHHACNHKEDFEDIYDKKKWIKMVISRQMYATCWNL